MIRNELDEEYKYLFEEAQDLAKSTETTTKMPRITKGQINRANTPVSYAYDYFKLNIFIPLLDHFLVSIKDRFNEHVKKAAAISSVLNILLIKFMMISLQRLKFIKISCLVQCLKLNLNSCYGNRDGHKLSKKAAPFHYHLLQSTTALQQSQ
ncbi:unnamed protein product [Didymodactylos carnosus]|uniref:Uncharacterized protein n=1 Tax=Didymodactylos carnosus TaxID=1234261 RepID=A0A815QZ77_9BILA|nr:unnamed protein product [Didymodactylos carnosus]CAF1469912.1 unnamed protein product [Didymodactylos carnosus]CAF3687237.1 unnamed protein product [Didymodactylos carnosus]CAF4337989.1 unnamed protein product [Didymodactylos carnosus]